MFERFTVEGRKALQQAQTEAARHGHNFIGTEHILLGVLQPEQPTSLGRVLLEEGGLVWSEVDAEVTAAIGAGSAQPKAKAPPFTPRAKTALELALRCALELGHHHIGPEHVVAGLVREGQGVAARILMDHGFTYDGVQREVGARSVAPANMRGPRRLPRRTGTVIGERVEVVQNVIRRSAPRPTPEGVAAEATPMVDAVLAGAQAAADAADTPMDSARLLMSLAEQEGSVAAAALESLGLTPAKLREALAAVDVSATSEVPEVFAALTITAGDVGTVTITDLAVVEALLTGLRSLCSTPSSVVDAGAVAWGTTALDLPQLEGPIRAAILIWLEDVLAGG